MVAIPLMLIVAIAYSANPTWSLKTLAALGMLLAAAGLIRDVSKTRGNIMYSMLRAEAAADLRNFIKPGDRVASS